jgi:choline dehydrogenase
LYFQVLLLEAGIEEPYVAAVPAFPPLLRESNIDWRYRTQPEKLSCRALLNGGCSWARGKVKSISIAHADVNLTRCSTGANMSVVNFV